MVGAAPRTPMSGPVGFVLTGIVVAIVHLLFARFSVAVPYVFGDEAGYLTKAAALAGLRTGAYSSYYPGYSLLLAPLYAADPHTWALYGYIQLLNAVLAGTTAMLLQALAGELAPEQPGTRHVAAAVAVACYAPFIAYSSFALSENLFVPLVVLLAWQLVRQLRHPGGGSVAAIGASGALLMLTHPKAAAVIVALYVSWAFGNPYRHRRWDPLLGLTVTLALFLPVQRLLSAFFKQRLGFYADGITGHYPGASSIIHDFGTLVSIEGVTSIALNIAGQVFYLSVASTGLVLAGAAAALMHRRRHPLQAGGGDGDGAFCAFSLYALLSLGLTILMTAFFMHRGGRVDSLFYGRYDEGVIALVLLMALVRPLPRAAWITAAAVMAGLGMWLVAAHGLVVKGEVVQLSVIGLQLWNGVYPAAVSVDRIDLAVIAVGGILLSLALGILARKPWLPWLAAALFLSGSWQASLGYLKPESDVNARKHRIVDYLHAHFPAVRCVDYDVRRAEYWSRYNYQVTLLPIRQHESAVGHLWPGQSDDGRTRQRCSNLVISADPALDRLYPRANMLVREAGTDERLWWVPR